MIIIWEAQTSIPRCSRAYLSLSWVDHLQGSTRLLGDDIMYHSWLDICKLFRRYSRSSVRSLSLLLNMFRVGELTMFSGRLLQIVKDLCAIEFFLISVLILLIATVLECPLEFGVSSECQIDTVNTGWTVVIVMACNPACKLRSINLWFQNNWL